MFFYRALIVISRLWSCFMNTGTTLRVGRYTCSIASCGAPCSMAAFSVASGWVVPRGLWIKRLRRLASSSQESNFQNSFRLRTKNRSCKFDLSCLNIIKYSYKQNYPSFGRTYGCVEHILVIMLMILEGICVNNSTLSL